MKALEQFVESDRQRFKHPHKELYLRSRLEIDRYFEFLKRVTVRYRKVKKRYLLNQKKFFASINKDGLLTPSQLWVFQQGLKLTTALHLEIESFYLFAKILLDKMAHFSEYYFGQQRNLPLDSHDDFVKNVQAFSTQKNLKLKGEMMGLSKQLKKEVSDYRDYQISHQKSPRRIHVTWSDSRGTLKISNAILYPKKIKGKTINFSDAVSSKDIELLFDDIKKHVELLTEWLKMNRNRANLKVTGGNAA